MSDLKDTVVYPGFTGEEYPDNFNIKAMPKPEETKKPGQLPDHMIRHFFEKVNLNKLCLMTALFIVCCFYYKSRHYWPKDHIISHLLNIETFGMTQMQYKI